MTTNQNFHFTKTDVLMYEMKTEDVDQDFGSDKEIFDFSNYCSKSKYYDDSNKLVIGRMKDETEDAVIKEFVGLKPKINSFFINDSKHKKAKDANKNFVATISHNEYKDVLLNNKCIRHSMNRIQSKDQKIVIYEVEKSSLPCFDDKIYIQNNRQEVLDLGYQS